jgi:hypothetical protein
LQPGFGNFKKSAIRAAIFLTFRKIYTAERNAGFAICERRAKLSPLSGGKKADA